jgi:hypothetical protein
MASEKSPQCGATEGSQIYIPTPCVLVCGVAVVETLIRLGMRGSLVSRSSFIVRTACLTTERPVLSVNLDHERVTHVCEELER